jgi:hypothetical protein
MKNYRIKKYHGMYSIRYTPQEKILFWWRNVFDFDPGYNTLEEAQKELCKHLRKPAVEYIDFDCERDCK